jgi:hypothetical protein|tara:strand:+ start:272 stop:589 length:318 start_codon:yes stop_codon:yes gene_type:complete
MANAFTLTADGTSRVLAVFNHLGRAFDSAVLDLCRDDFDQCDFDEVDEADSQGLIVLDRDGSRADRLTRDDLKRHFRKAVDGTSVRLTIPRQSAGAVTLTFHEVR